MSNVNSNSVQLADLARDSEQLCLIVLMLSAQPLGSDEFFDIAIPLLEKLHSNLGDLNGLITLQNHLVKEQFPLKEVS